MVHNVSELRMNGAIFLVKGPQAAVNANHKDERCSLLLKLLIIPYDLDPITIASKFEKNMITSACSTSNKSPYINQSFHACKSDNYYLASILILETKVFKIGTSLQDRDCKIGSVC